jgi:hypothetical protein
MVGAGAATATVMTAYRYTSGMRGYGDAELDDEEVERREAAKKARRRPLSETIEQLGEGRGENDYHIKCGHAANKFRNLCSWLRREEAPALDGQVRYRCQGRTGGELDVPDIFLAVLNPAPCIDVGTNPSLCIYIYPSKWHWPVRFAYPIMNLDVKHALTLCMFTFCGCNRIACDKPNPAGSRRLI